MNLALALVAAALILAALKLRKRKREKTAITTALQEMQQEFAEQRIKAEPMLGLAAQIERDLFAPAPVVSPRLQKAATKAVKEKVLKLKKKPAKKKAAKKKAKK